MYRATLAEIAKTTDLKYYRSVRTVPFEYKESNPQLRVLKANIALEKSLKIGPVGSLVLQA